MNTFRNTIQKGIIRITFLLILIVIPLYAWKVIEKQDYTDFDVYYRSAQRANLGEWNLVYTLQDGASPFRYAPVWIPFFQPLAKLPLPYAKLTWYALQCLWFALGFYFIFLTLKACVRKAHSFNPYWITCLGILFILRFCLDTFTIGQVSSLMFLGFSLGLYGWVVRKPSLSTLGILIPTLLKIGPGFLFGVFLSSRYPEKRRVVFAGITISILVGMGYLLWFNLFHPFSTFSALWENWFQIVINDSSYYDASHYGSQSLKSVLLRAVRTQKMTLNLAQELYFFLSVALCGLTASFWLFRRPLSFQGRAYFYCLGVFVYLWVMPETFKYSLTPLAIPVVFLIWDQMKPSDRKDDQKDSFGLFSLIFGALTLSLAGKDLIGDSLFFGLQQRSVPFVATVFLGMACFRQAWRHSQPSSFSQGWIQTWNSARSTLGPWNRLPHETPSLSVSLLVPVPLTPSSSLDGALIRRFLVECHSILTQKVGSSFEILIIPYGDRLSEFHPVLIEIQKLASKLASQLSPPKRSLSLLNSPLAGRGSALREGFLSSQGKKILISQIEQPCDARFYEKALDELDSGADLVRANRRLAESRFNIPVRALSLVYGRHRLGHIFNQIVQWIVPKSQKSEALKQSVTFLSSSSSTAPATAAHTTSATTAAHTTSAATAAHTTSAATAAHRTHEPWDFLSGNLAISRRLATQAFAIQTSSDFLFEFELSLTALALGCVQKDLPVTLFLAGEKSLLRVLHESLSILLGVPRLARRYRKGYFHFQPNCAGITADDWGLSPAVNAGILDLARRGIVRRVSMMADCPYLAVGLQELAALPKIELGLHFNLTHQKTFLSPGRFLLQWNNPFSSKTTRIKQIELVRSELSQQFQKIRNHGIQLKYLDGHHHIHIVPGVLEVLADLIQKEGIYQVRLPYDSSLWFSLKAPLVGMAFLLKSKMKKLNFDYLPCIYPRARDFQDQGRLRSKLAFNLKTEVIVHPAIKNDIQELKIPDSYTEGRVTEYQALQMLGFTQ